MSELEPGAFYDRQEVGSLAGLAACEYLLSADDQPVLGIYDLGIRNVMNLVRPPGGAWNEYIQYRDHKIVGLPPVSPENQQARFDAQLRTGLLVVRPNRPLPAAQIGVYWADDMWNELPVGMWRAGHIASFDEVESKRLAMLANHLTVLNGNTKAAGQDFVETFMSGHALEPTFIVGGKAIIDFLVGMAEGSEADKPKRMAWTQCNYLLPRVDADLLSATVSAYNAGIPADKLPIPEEHRLRVLVSIADTLAWYYTQSRQTLDDRRDFESGQPTDMSQIHYELSHPLDLVMRTNHSRTDLERIVAAYRIDISELIEVAQHLWYGHYYWFDKASERGGDVDLYEYFHRKPDSKWPMAFVAEHDPATLDYYNSMIARTIMAAVNPNYMDGDITARTILMRPLYLSVLGVSDEEVPVQ